MEFPLSGFLTGVFFLLLFSMDYWGPGVRRILNAIATRIAKGTPSPEPSNHEPLLQGRMKYVPWLLALPPAVWFAIKVGQWAVSIA